jgi:uncharacterized protein (TIGR00251 family)
MGCIDAREVPEGVLLGLKVKPNSGRFCLHDDGTLDVKSPPAGGKANREAVRGLGRMFGCEVRIVMGMTSRNKMFLLRGMSAEKLNSMLNEE